MHRKSDEDDQVDWYVARKLEGTMILEVAYYLKDTITQDAITAADFRQRVFEVSQVNPNFTKHIVQVDWQKLRTIVRRMHKKYTAEENHEIYNNFISLARRHVRNTYI